MTSGRLGRGDADGCDRGVCSACLVVFSDDVVVISRGCGTNLLPPCFVVALSTTEPISQRRIEGGGDGIVPPTGVGVSQGGCGPESDPGRARRQ